MGITDAAIARLRPAYPDIGVIARRAAMGDRAGLVNRLDTRLGQRSKPVDEPPGPVVAVRLTIEGIRGGRLGDRSARMRYLLVVDVSALGEGMPSMWIRSPLDRDIAHVNIWPASQSFCPWSGTWLPSLCWNTFAVAWDEAPSAQRTLGGALEFARQLLNTENHESPAR